MKLSPRDGARLLAERTPQNTFEARFGRFGEQEVRGGTAGISDIPLERTEWRAEQSSGRMTVRGHASVFDRLSLDLGWFKERVHPAAFDAVLDANPHVTLNHAHDDTLILGSTRALDPYNGGLELRTDDQGLRFFSRVIHDPDTGALPSYAEDLRIAMRAGVVQQASFCFIVGRDEWLIDENDNVTRTILEISDLLDVCVCAMGAYPQTDSELVRSMVTGAARERLGAAGAPSEPTGPDGAPTVAVLEEAGTATQRKLEDAERRRRVASARVNVNARRNG